MEDIKQRQIEQLQRDIRILEEILFRQDRELHQSSNSSPQRRFIEVPIRFGEVTRKTLSKGGIKRGLLHERMRVHVCTYIPIQDNKPKKY